MYMHMRCNPRPGRLDRATGFPLQTIGKRQLKANRVPPSSAICAPSVVVPDLIGDGAGLHGPSYDAFPFSRHPGTLVSTLLRGSPGSCKGQSADAVPRAHVELDAASADETA